MTNASMPPPRIALIMSRAELADPRSIVPTPERARSSVMKRFIPCSSRSRCITESFRPQSPTV